MSDSFVTLWTVTNCSPTGSAVHATFQARRLERESESEVAQSCPTLCYLMDCSLSGFSVHGIFQARVLEWIVVSFSRGSSRPRNRTRVSHIAGRRFTVWATREAQWVAISFSRGPSWSRYPTWVSSLAGGLLTTEPPGKP